MFSRLVVRFCILTLALLQAAAGLGADSRAMQQRLDQLRQPGATDWRARLMDLLPEIIPVHPTYMVVASDAPLWMRHEGANTYVCDGTTDEEQIQAANDAIVAGPGKGVIELSPGSFSCSATVTLGSNVTLRGAGEGKTILTLVASVNNPILTNTDWDNDNNYNSNIAVQGITFQGNRANQTSSKVTIKDALGNTAALFFMEVNGLRVTDCEINDAAWAGTCMVECSDIWVLGNRLDNSNDDSIAVDRASTRAVLRDNVITDVGKSNDYGGPAGIEIQDGASYVLVEGNQITGATTLGKSNPNGISVNSHGGQTAPHHVTIRGNTIKDCTAPSVTLSGDDAAEWPYDVVIADNLIVLETMGGSHDAIQLLQAKRVSVTGNRIYKNDVDYLIHGIEIDQAEDVTISGNLLHVLSGGNNAADFGISIGNSGINALDLDRVQIVHNTLINTDWAPIYISDANGTVTFDDVLIAENTFASPDVACGYTFIWNDGADGSGGTFTNVVVRDNLQKEAVTAEHYNSANSNFCGTGWTGDSLAFAIAADGEATHAAATLSPSCSRVRVTNNDTHGANVTMSETGVVDGLEITIENISANHLDFADTADVCELSGAVVLGQYDVLRLRYEGDRWVQVSLSDN